MVLVCTIMVQALSIVLLVTVTLLGQGQASNNGLARTPPMGWLAWEVFRCNTDCKDHPTTCVSEELFKTMADVMVEQGYKDLGYEYVNIDDCWMAPTRDAQGKLQPDPDRFPNGIKALADYIHSKGLKLGIYNDYGNKTCAGFPGSLGHLETDAQTFADWGVDSLKMDGCNSNVSLMKQAYPEMFTAMNKTGRPILFSCSWPDYERAENITIDWPLVKENCNIWRNYYDIDSNWPSVRRIIDYNIIHHEYNAVIGPGNFNDMDMLVVGNSGLNYEQMKTQLAIWAIRSSPLLMGNDLRKVNDQQRALLQNKQIIRISQDPLGNVAKFLQDQVICMWTKNLTGSEFATVIFNNDSTSMANYTVPLKTFGYAPGMYHLTDVYTGDNYLNYGMDDLFSALIKPDGVVVILAQPVTRHVSYDIPNDIPNYIPNNIPRKKKIMIIN